MTERVSPEELRRNYALPVEDDALLAECDVTVFRAPGPGGQHRNVTESAVRLQHRPSGLVVIGRRERSQRRNLEDALGRLRERLRILLIPPKKRRPTRPTAASREKRLEEKRRRSRIKRQRTRDPE
jgi:protein subunit release factor B